MWWPIWASAAAVMIVGLWWVRDRSAMIGAVIVLAGLLATQAGWPPRIHDLAALTIWSVAVALIVISTRPSIIALLFAILIPLCYLPVVAFGAHPLNWYRLSDACGIGLLLALMGSGILTWRSGPSHRAGLVHNGPSRKGVARAFQRLARAQEKAKPEALTDL